MRSRPRWARDHVIATRRFRLALLALVAALVVSVAVAASVGSVWIEPATVVRVLAWRVGLIDRPAELARSTEVILLGLRLPRVALAAVVGAALASSGMVFQALFRNPLADPAVIGVSSGAALGAVAVIVTVGGAAMGGAAVPLVAFLGAMAVGYLVYRLARVGPAVNVATLLLAGIAVAAVVSALMSLVMTFSGERLRDIYTWLLGGLVAQGWRSVAITLPVVVVGVVATARVAHDLNLLSLGEERAGQLGVDVGSLKRTALAAGALLAAAAVSVGGIIGFVGLMTPHLLRLVVGADHRRLLPAVLLGGPVLLVLSDLAARTVVAPQELPVGVVTALLGGPFFLALLQRTRSRGRA